jgi:hypothetical protein
MKEVRVRTKDEAKFMGHLLGWLKVERKHAGECAVFFVDGGSLSELQGP